MSTSDVPYSVSVEEAFISASINASMLFNFLMGIYTMVYAGTMYLYLSRKAANMNRRIVLSAISVLYLLGITDFICQWYLINLQVVINGDTRESIFFSTVEGGPRWFLAFEDFLFYSSFIVSDALLIWRCYHVWGRSFRVISVPVILLIAQFGLLITVTILSAMFTSITSEENANISDNIESSQIFVSLATTVISACLIGYRILFASALNGPQSKRMIFSRIVVLVIESAAAYSLALLLYAIFTVVPSFTVLGSPLLNVGLYMQLMVTIAAGMAPTILVARIAFTTDPNNTIAATATHISALRFGSQQGRGRGASVSGGEITISLHRGDEALAQVGEKMRESNRDDSLGGYQV